MPELPEAETMARDLDRATAGHQITDVLVRYAPIVASEHFKEILTGSHIEKVGRLGKWIHFHLEKGRALLVHLKMTGQFITGHWPTSDLWPPHTHIAFRISDMGENDTLFYRDIRKFGRLRAFEKQELAEFLATLAHGPDPLTITPTDFYNRITGKKGRLKGVLLDQSIIAGLGNIYVDESLFAASLSPLRSAHELSRKDTDLLLSEIQRLLHFSINLRGSTVSNYQGLEGGGLFQNHHLVYGKSGQICPRCGETFLKVTVAGRSSVYCPHCQK